jgi:cardiolipin synthase A/B
MSFPDMKLITAVEYYDALMREIPKAKRRVVINAMTLLWGDKTEKILPLLHDALERGVEVRLMGDIYSKFYSNTPKIVRDSDDYKWSHTRAINIKLEAEGAYVRYVGKLGLNPYRGRCHTKITIIDDTAYTFGGVNFTGSSFTFHDYMLRIESSVLSDRLYVLVKEIAKGKKGEPLPDLREPIDSHNTLLFDGGGQGTSAIYEAACEIIGDAKKVYFVSQWCPSGKLAKLLTATDNDSYFIRAAQAEPPANIATIVDQTRYHIDNRYTGKRYIHAKFILTENADGSRHLVSGSNNFNWRGIAYGTKEIAVRSSDPKLWQQFYDYMQREIVHES